MRPSDLLASSLLLIASADAWSFFGTPNRDAAQLDKRQRTTYDLSFTGIQGDTDTVKSTRASTGNNAADSTANPTGSGSVGQTGTRSSDDSMITGSGTASGSRGASNDMTTSIDPRVPAGGISMLTPDALTGQKYFKIKDYVTFAWNYTSLSIKPSYVDILATCTQNQATYTLALNQTFKQTQEVVWDTGDYQATGTIPLLTETYTLIVHDAGQAVSAQPQPGRLGTYQQFSFGMYVPQEYTPMAEYVCATCSGAMSLVEKQTMGFLFAMAGLTVLSFGWFAGVAGVW